MFGNEQHSPILCIGHGIPAIVCRYKEQTSIGPCGGTSGWTSDLQEADKDLTPSVLATVNDQAAARVKAAKAKAIADGAMKRMLDVLRAELEA